MLVGPDGEPIPQPRPVVEPPPPPPPPAKPATGTVTQQVTKTQALVHQYSTTIQVDTTEIGLAKEFGDTASEQLYTSERAQTEKDLTAANTKLKVLQAAQKAPTTYKEGPPPTTVSNPVTKAVKPQLTHAQGAAASATSAVSADKSAEAKTQAQINAVVDSGDYNVRYVEGLEAQYKQEQGKLTTDTQAQTKANAQVSADQTVVYGQQVKGDYSTLHKEGVMTVTAQGQFALTKPASKLTPTQIKQYDQFNAYLGAYGQFYQQTQLYVSDPKEFGNAGTSAVNGVQSALSTLSYWQQPAQAMWDPAAIKASKAKTLLQQANEGAQDDYSTWYAYTTSETYSAAATKAQQDPTGANLLAAAKARGAMDQAVGYEGMLYYKDVVQPQDTANVAAAQTAWDKNPYSQKTADALSHAELIQQEDSQQYQVSVAQLQGGTVEAAAANDPSGTTLALDQAASSKASTALFNQENPGNVCVAPNPALQTAASKAQTALTAAQDSPLQTLSTYFQGYMWQTTVAQAQWVHQYDPTDFVSPAPIPKGMSSSDVSSWLKNTEQGAQVELARDTFDIDQPSNIVDPQTDADKNTASQTWDTYITGLHLPETNETTADQFADLAPGQKVDAEQGLSELDDDADAEQQQLASRSWMQVAWDGVSGHDTGTTNYLDTKITQLQNLMSNEDNMSATRFNSQYESIMSNVSTQFDSQLDSQQADAQTWSQAQQAVTQVAEVAAAAAVTMATGGAGAVIAIGLGTAAGMAVSQGSAALQNYTTLAQGGSVSQDPGVSIFTVWTNNFGRQGVTSAERGQAYNGLEVDAINSFGAAAGASFGGALADAAGDEAIPSLLTRVGLADVPEGATPELAQNIISANKVSSFAFAGAKGAVAGVGNQLVMGAAQQLSTQVQVSYDESPQTVGWADHLSVAQGNQQIAENNNLTSTGLISAPFAGALSGVTEGRPLLQLGTDAAANTAFTAVGQWAAGQPMNAQAWTSVGTNTALQIFGKSVDWAGGAFGTRGASGSEEPDDGDDGSNSAPVDDDGPGPDTSDGVSAQAGDPVDPADASVSAEQPPAARVVASALADPDAAEDPTAGVDAGVDDPAALTDPVAAATPAAPEDPAGAADPAIFAADPEVTGLPQPSAAATDAYFEIIVNSESWSEDAWSTTTDADETADDPAVVSATDPADLLPRTADTDADLSSIINAETWSMEDPWSTDMDTQSSDSTSGEYADGDEASEGYAGGVYAGGAAGRGTFATGTLLLEAPESVATVVESQTELQQSNETLSTNDTRWRDADSGSARTGTEELRTETVKWAEQRAVTVEASARTGTANRALVGNPDTAPGLIASGKNGQALASSPDAALAKAVGGGGGQQPPPPGGRTFTGGTAPDPDDEGEQAQTAMGQVPSTDADEESQSLPVTASQTLEGEESEAQSAQAEGPEGQVAPSDSGGLALGQKLGSLPGVALTAGSLVAAAVAMRMGHADGAALAGMAIMPGFGLSRRGGAAPSERVPLLFRVGDYRALDEAVTRGAFTPDEHYVYVFDTQNLGGKLQRPIGYGSVEVDSPAAGTTPATYKLVWRGMSPDPHASAGQDFRQGLQSEAHARLATEDFRTVLQDDPVTPSLRFAVSTAKPDTVFGGSKAPKFGRYYDVHDVTPQTWAKGAGDELGVRAKSSLDDKYPEVIQDAKDKFVATRSDALLHKSRSVRKALGQELASRKARVDAIIRGVLPDLARTVLGTDAVKKGLPELVETYATEVAQTLGTRAAADFTDPRSASSAVINRVTELATDFQSKVDEVQRLTDQARLAARARTHAGLDDAVSAVERANSQARQLSQRFEAVRQALLRDFSRLLSSAGQEEALAALQDSAGPLSQLAVAGATSAVSARIERELQYQWSGAYHAVLANLKEEVGQLVQAKVDGAFDPATSDQTLAQAEKKVDSKVGFASRPSRDPEGKAVAAGERTAVRGLRKAVREEIPRTVWAHRRSIRSEVDARIPTVVNRFILNDGAKDFLMGNARYMSASAELHAAALEGARKALQPDGPSGPDPTLPARSEARTRADTVVRTRDSDVFSVLQTMLGGSASVVFHTDDEVRLVQAAALELHALGQKADKAVQDVRQAAADVNQVITKPSIPAATSAPTPWDPPAASPLPTRRTYTPDPSSPAPEQAQIAGSLHSRNIAQNVKNAGVRASSVETVERMSEQAAQSVPARVVDDEVTQRMLASEPAVVAVVRQHANDTADDVVARAQSWSVAGDAFAKAVVQEEGAQEHIDRLTARSAAAANTGTERMKTQAREADGLLEQARAEFERVKGLQQELQVAIKKYKADRATAKVVQEVVPVLETPVARGATRTVRAQVVEQLNNGRATIESAAAASVGPEFASALATAVDPLQVRGRTLSRAAQHAARTELDGGGNRDDATRAAQSALETAAASHLEPRISAEASRIATDTRLQTLATAGANSEAERLLSENRRDQISSTSEWAQAAVAGARQAFSQDPTIGRAEAESAATAELSNAEADVKTVLDALLDPGPARQLTSTPQTFDDEGRRAIAAQAAALKSAREHLSDTLSKAQEQVDKALSLRRTETYHLANKPGGQNAGEIESISVKRSARKFARRKNSLWLTKSPGGLSSDEARTINQHAVILNDLYRATLGARHVSDVRIVEADDGTTASASRLISGLKYPGEKTDRFYSPEAIERSELWKLLGVSIIVDNKSLGPSSSDTSSDVGFRGTFGTRNFVVLDTDSGFGFKSDHSRGAFPDTVDVDAFIRALPEGVRKAFTDMGEDLRQRSYTWAVSALTDEVIDSVVGPDLKVGSSTRGLADTLKARRDSLATEAHVTPREKTKVAAEATNSDFHWADSLRKFQFPDGYARQGTQPPRGSRLAVYVERFRVDLTGSMHKGLSIHPSQNLEHWNSITLEKNAEGEDVLMIADPSPTDPNRKTELEQIRIGVNPYQRRPFKLRLREGGFGASWNLGLDVAAGVGGFFFRTNQPGLTSGSEGRSLFDFGELHGVVRGAALDSVTRGHLIDTSRLVSQEVAATLRLIGRLRKMSDIVVPLGMEEQIVRNASDFMGLANRYVKSDFGTLDDEPVRPAGLDTEASKEYDQRILELRRQHIEEAHEKYLALQKQAMGDFVPQNLHLFHPTTWQATVSRYFQRLTYAAVIGSSIEPMIHMQEGIAGWVSVGGIALKVAALGLDQIVRNRPYPWEEGRTGKLSEWLDLLTNPTFGTGAFLTVISTAGKLHNPADWVVEIGHGAVGVGAYLIGGPGVWGKLRETSVASRELDYRRDLAEYQTFFKMYPEEALKVSAPKKPRRVPASWISVGAGTAVISGGIYNIIDFYRLFEGSPPHPKSHPATHPTPRHPTTHSTPGHTTVPTKPPQQPHH